GSARQLPGRGGGVRGLAGSSGAAPRGGLCLRLRSPVGRVPPRHGTQGRPHPPRLPVRGRGRPPLPELPACRRAGSVGRVVGVGGNPDVGTGRAGLVRRPRGRLSARVPPWGHPRGKGPPVCPTAPRGPAI